MRILKNFGKRISPWTPVRIMWEDASGSPGWQKQRDLLARPVQIETVAIFVQEMNHSVHLATSIDEHETPQIGDHLIIPTGCIISIEKLK